MSTKEKYSIRELFEVPAIFIFKGTEISYWKPGYALPNLFSEDPDEPCFFKDGYVWDGQGIPVLLMIEDPLRPPAAMIEEFLAAGIKKED